MKREKQKKEKKAKRVRLNSQNTLSNFLSFENARLAEDDVKNLSKVRAENALSYIFKVSIGGKTQYMSLIAIYGIDIFHFSNDDKRAAFHNFAYATSMIKLPHKYIFSRKSKTASVCRPQDTG